jgi:hypothetical protein
MYVCGVMNVCAMYVWCKKRSSYPHQSATPACPTAWLPVSAQPRRTPEHNPGPPCGVPFLISSPPRPPARTRTLSLSYRKTCGPRVPAPITSAMVKPSVPAIPVATPCHKFDSPEPTSRVSFLVNSISIPPPLLLPLSLPLPLPRFLKAKALPTLSHTLSRSLARSLALCLSGGCCILQRSYLQWAPTTARQ